MRLLQDRGAAVTRQEGLDAGGTKKKSYMSFCQVGGCGGCVETRSCSAVERRCVHMPVCARTFGDPMPNEIMDLSDRISENGGEK